MSPVSVARIGALLAAVAALSVVSAGCIAQDRPEHAEFYIVADAGPDLSVPVGTAVPLEWAHTHAVEADTGDVPHVDLEYSWHASGEEQPISHTETASLTRSEVGLAIVSLEVAAEGASATDATAVFFSPPPADTETHLYIIVTGGLRIWEDPGAGLAIHDVELEGFAAQWADLPLSSGSPDDATVVLTFSDVDVVLASEVEGSVLLVIKHGEDPAELLSLGPVAFDASNWYEVDLRQFSPARLWETPRGENVGTAYTFSDFATAHPAEGESRTLVAETQTLPGFSAQAAVAAALGAAALAVAVSRRRR